VDADERYQFLQLRHVSVALVTNVVLLESCVNTSASNACDIMSLSLAPWWRVPLPAAGENAPGGRPTGGCNTAVKASKPARRNARVTGCRARRGENDNARLRSRAPVGVPAPGEGKVTMAIGERRVGLPRRAQPNGRGRIVGSQVRTAGGAKTSPPDPS
jgi:hypothetical protein